MLTDSPRIVIAKPPRRSKRQGLAKLPLGAPRIIRPKPEPPPDHTGADAADALWRELARRVTDSILLGEVAERGVTLLEVACRQCDRHGRFRIAGLPCRAWTKDADARLAQPIGRRLPAALGRILR